VDPIAALREQLAERKQAGERFDDAWTTALGEIAACVEHDTTVAALDATRDTWQRAYLGQPETPGERACRALWQALDSEPDVLAVQR